MRWRGSSPRSRAAACRRSCATSCSRRRAKAKTPGARHHRHRRRGQELAHRRAGAPLPPRPGRRAEDRDPLDRPVAAQVRRRAARRPHPHERDRASEHLHALARHARRRQRDLRRRCPTRSPRARPRASTWSIVETSGIGQGDAAIVPLVDVSLYVMTPEFGAASQLEKIDMLDFADFVAINKFDRKGAEDALRDVRKQIPAQPRGCSSTAPDDDAGVRHHRLALQRRRRHRALPGASRRSSRSKGLKLDAGQAADGRPRASRPRRT